MRQLSLRRLMTRRDWLTTMILAGLALPLREKLAYAQEIEVEGKFKLVDQMGRRRTEADLRGKPTILFLAIRIVPISAQRSCRI